jgi:hypothetical protein
MLEGIECCKFGRRQVMDSDLLDREPPLLPDYRFSKYSPYRKIETHRVPTVVPPSHRRKTSFTKTALLDKKTHLTFAFYRLSLR